MGSRTDMQPGHGGQTLTKKTPAIGRSIAAAFVLKDEDMYLLTNQHGNVPMKRPHGFGLYYHDCRFLNGYVLRMDSRAPIALVSNSTEGKKGIFELTNPELPKAGGGELDKHEIAIRWDRLIDGEQRALHEVLRVRSFSDEPVDVTIALSFQAGFEDVYEVRGLCAARTRAQPVVTWDGDRLRLCHVGDDRVLRATEISFRRRPDATEGKCARFRLHLAPDAEEEIALSIQLFETAAGTEPRATPGAAKASSDPGHTGHTEPRETRGPWEVRTDNAPLNRTLTQCFCDLETLRSTLEGEVFHAAGVPWFVALFGRDALLTAMETLACDPDPARDTLRLLARHQATQDDPARDEEPGKILHEYRVGELAHIGAIPHTPYYGTVDATALFLILLARHAAWTGRLDMFQELRPNVDAALGWIADYGASKQTGYVEYRSRATGGLANQGWKDSGDAIMMENGALAKQPIALVEVQGYVVLAKRLTAGLFERAGDAARAATLRHEASALERRFANDFWLKDKGILALAQTPDGPAAVLSSNAGQALWSGIVRPDEARRTMESLMSEPMWSGWGIRTLSEQERRYNPLAYHRGTVWPHDNALIAAGFRRYGFDDAACRVFQGIVDASTHFPMHRLPELFAGFRRSDYGVPVSYPVACHPQAFAAASVPYMLERLLGLEPEAFDHRLRIVRPVLPESIGMVEWRGLRVGSDRVDLRFERRPNGHAHVDVLRNDGALRVDVERDGTESGPPPA